MVSIKYFWGVGEFCRMKSIPRGCFTSRSEEPAAPSAATSTITRRRRDNRLRTPPVPDILGLMLLARLPFLSDSEKELHCELNQSWVGSRSGAGDNSKVGVVRIATSCVGRGKLRAVEQIEEFNPRLHTNASLPTQQNSLKNREVEIVDSVGPQRRISPRLVTEGEVCGSGK